MVGTALDRCFAPERGEIELDRFKGLGSNRRLSGVDGRDQPLAALKTEHLQRAGVRVEEPQMGNTLPGINTELEAAIDALRRRRQDLTHPVRGELETGCIGDGGKSLSPPPGEVGDDVVISKTELGFDEDPPSSRSAASLMKGRANSSI